MGTQIAVTLRPDEPFDLNARLTLLVIDLADKWLTPEPDRRPIPRAKILLITRHRQQFIELTPHNPKASWRQYEFWYLGGRSEVRLSIKRS